MNKKMTNGERLEIAVISALPPIAVVWAMGFAFIYHGGSLFLAFVVLAAVLITACICGWVHAEKIRQWLDG